MTDAVADLVKAEAALAAAQIGDEDDPAEVAGARAQRDRARAEVERIKAEPEARDAARAVDDGSQAARDAIREQVRSQVRTEVPRGGPEQLTQSVVRQSGGIRVYVTVLSFAELRKEAAMENPPVRRAAAGPTGGARNSCHC